MGYELGVDLGTTYTAAATARSGRAEIVALGNRGAVIPSVVFVRPDGKLLVGEGADRRAVTEPGQVVREFKRRVGDPSPIVVGGGGFAPQALMAAFIPTIVEAVAAREGGQPERLALTHPANWSPTKVALLVDALDRASLPDIVTVTEPEAAAIAYSSAERIEPGAIVAVYDLGGGTFDAALLRRTAERFEIIGQPEGLDRLGGVDFDAAVFAHVNRFLDGALDGIDHSDPATAAAISRLRADCVEAKEALSADTDVAIPVMLPGLRTEVRMTRTEFEAMIRPALSDTIGALRRAMRSAAVAPADVEVVLLVGGSSRIPLVAQLVGAEVGRPVAVDIHPKHAVALGAALVASVAEPVPRTGPSVPAVPATPPGPAAVPSIPTVPPGGSVPVVAGAAPTEALPAVSLSAAALPNQPPGLAPSADLAAAASASSAEGAAPVSYMANPGPAAPDGGGRLTAPPGATESSGGEGSAGPPPGAAVPGFTPAVVTAAQPAVGGPAPPQRVPFASPAPTRSRRLPLIAALVVLVVGVIAAVVVLSSRGGDETSASTTTEAASTTSSAGSSTTPPTTASSSGSSASTSSSASTTTAAPTTTVPPAPACPAATGPYACISAVTVDGAGQLVVTWSAKNFTPLISDDPTKFHVHFYFPVGTMALSPANAGVSGPEPGTWILFDKLPTFAGYSKADATTAGATSICVLVANSNHSVQVGTGNCMPIPA